MEKFVIGLFQSVKINKVREKTKKIISLFLFTIIVGYYFILPFQVKKADAFMGIGDITFNTTIGDIPKKLSDLADKLIKVGLRKLKKRLLTQLQNDLVNFVQNGGTPRFIKDPKGFLLGAAETATVNALDEVFSAEGIDICSPFKMNVEFLINEITTIPEYGARCTLGDIADNLGKFSVDFYEGGGWNAWMKVNENNMPLAYFKIGELIAAKVEREGNVVTAQIAANSGFLDQKVCHAISIPRYTWRDESKGVLTENDFKPAAIDAIKALWNSGTSVSYTRTEEPTGDQKIYCDFLIDIKKTDPSATMTDRSGRELTEADCASETVTETYDLNDYLKKFETIRMTLTARDLGFSEGIPMNKMPKNTFFDAICTDEETITPGSTVGEWVTGGLKKMGIDNIVENEDIAVIVDAVLNAATNRAMKEGLSLIKSGRGTNSRPANGPSKNITSQPQTEGLESPAGISMQNQMSDILNNSQKLIKSLEDLGLKQENKETKFDTRVKEIMGISYTPLRTRNKDTSLTDVIDRLFGKYKDNYLRYEITQNNFVSLWDRFNKFSDRSNFNEEANMPSLYFVNKTLNSSTESVWRSIKERFRELSERSTYGSKNQCIDVYYTLSPAIVDGDDKLPFIVDEDDSTGWASDDHSYLTNLKNTASERKSEYFPVNEFMLYAASQTNEIEARINNLARISESYGPLIENAGQMIEDLKKDRETITNNLRNVSLYTSLLLDYDKEGSATGTGLIERIKNYNSLMGKGDSKDSDILYAYERLLVVQNSTRIAWKKSQQDIIDSEETTQDEKETARIKIGYIDKTNEIIKSELEKIKLPINVATVLGIVESEEVKDQEINYSQTGFRLSYALAEAMEIDIEMLGSEFDEIQEKINRYQTDISNQLGEQITEKEAMQNASLDGGDTEWEKYYQNRTQLVYALFIYDLYERNFLDSFCNDEGSGGSYAQPNDPNDVDNGYTATPKPTTLPETIKIMPLGDSNTSGYSSDEGDTASSYRQKLVTKLGEETNVNYVVGGYYPGWKIKNIQDLVDNNIIRNANPEIALLMIGTNDMYYEVPTGTILDPDLGNPDNRYPIYENSFNVIDGITQKLADLKKLLATMLAKNPSMNIIVAKISSPTGGNAQILSPNLPMANVTKMFHDRIDNVVAEIGSDKITTVDMWDCGTVPSMSDGLHYTADGYQCLANKWADGIRALYSK